MERSGESAWDNGNPGYTECAVVKGGTQMVAKGKLTQQLRKNMVVFIGYVHQNSVNAGQIIPAFTIVWHDN
jgi:hypothetical protein